MATQSSRPLLAHLRRADDLRTPEPVVSACGLNHQLIAETPSGYGCLSICGNSCVVTIDYRMMVQNTKDCR
ncbi:MAG TPA: hypothetical protein VMW38_20670, partial [Terriglobia bacterium]|nr:hypothetical protein [Terriglobia bacterium]